MNLTLWLVASALSCFLFGAVAWAEPNQERPASASAGGAREQDVEARGSAREPDQVALIDLNKANVAELTRLPGIGQKRAEAIVAFREGHGGFQSVTQLLKIKGIGRAMLRKLRLLVTISGEPRLPRDTALATAKPTATGSHGIHQVR